MSEQHESAPAGPHAWRHDLAPLVVVVIWGLNFSVTKTALAQLHPLVFTSLRFTLSVAFLGLLLLRERPPSPDDAPRPRVSRWNVILLGVVGHFVYQILFILGLDMTTSGNSALLIAGSPLWTALLGRATGLETLRRIAWLGLLIAFAGTAVLALTRGEVDFENRTLVGNLLTLGAAVGWGAYTLWTKPLLRSLSPTALSFYSMAAALPLLWIVTLPFVGGVRWTELGADVVFAIAYAGILSSGVAYTLWAVAVRRVGASQTAAYVNLVPIVALAGGALFLQESITPRQIVGGTLVLLGLLLVRRARVA